MIRTLPATRYRLPHIQWRLLLNAFALVFLFVLWRHLLSFPGDAVDVHAYWSVNLNDPYNGAMAGGTDAFLYAPPFAQLVSPLTGLPFSAFMGLWMALSMAALVYLVGPVAAAALMFTLPVHQDVLTGNIHLMMTAAIVVGFRYPGAWAFILLTKITPGVGLLWFAIRREWRPLGIVAIATLGVSLASFLLAPHLWWEWAAMLLNNVSHPYAGPNAIQIPLIVRMPTAALIVIVGARRGWRWVLPVAAMISLPVLWFWETPAMLIGCYALWRHRETPG